MTRVRTLVLTIALAAAVVGGYVAVRPPPPEVPRFCTAEAVIGPDGRTYGRDPDQGCRFVDEDGRVLTDEELLGGPTG